MSTQGTTPYGSPQQAQQPQPPARRKMGTIMTVSGLVVVAALVAGFFVFRHHGPIDPKSVRQTTAWNSTSNNWSGYAETSAQTGQKYTQVTAEWTVPSVVPTSSSALSCSAQWDGIGGATSKDLIQLGTDSCSASGQTGYYAWYEVLPASNVIVPSLNIVPGDRVLASLQLVSGGAGANPQAEATKYAAVVRLINHFDPNFGTSHIVQRLRQLWQGVQPKLAAEPWFPEVSAELRSLFTTPAASGPQMWKFSFTVTAPNGSVQTFSKTVAYQSSLSSVEWITEAPTLSTGIEPLPNYGIAHFLGASVNGGTASLTAGDQIILADPHGEASVPSATVGTASEFNTCYFPTFTVTACPVP